MNEQSEERTKRQIVVREVTHMQASWTEAKRGAPGDFTLQLILDNGAEQRAFAITPVPSGVGPMTRAMLLYNTLQAVRAGVESR